ncbi:MAG: glycosyltransferase [Deltaproteobacteria bacterium]|nr:glycosyltransferase [Deltaproteobacteria bacterium]
MPRVSVVLPVRDAEATLAAALESVAAQSLADHEVVVVLNGCRDGSEAVARAHAARDPRVRCLTLPQAGLVPALDAGLRAARAPLVARLDADDRMCPPRLARQVAALGEHPEWAAVTGGVRHVAAVDGTRGDGMARHVDWLNGLETPDEIRAARFIDAPVAHPAVSFRQDAIRGLGGYRDGPFPEDYDLWLRFFAAGLACGRVTDLVVEWRDRGDRLTRTDPRYAPDAVRALKHRFLLDGPLAGGRHCRVWGAGPYGRRHARDLGRAGALVDDLVDIDPRKVGRRVAGGRPVVGLDAVGPPDGRLVLLAPASRGAREQVAAFLEARGHRVERDYLALQ